MATISSHVLDSVVGDHARAIAIDCIRVSDRHTLFSSIANEEGRISEQVEIEPDTEYELVFHTAAYFANRSKLPSDGGQILNSVVVRLQMPDPQGKYHIPVMISPHSYNIWWSGVNPQ
jgi:5-hydroxyisourate hydrolase